MATRCRVLGLLLILTLPGPLAEAAGPSGKEEAIASVDRQAAGLIGLSREIWRYAETALREERSAEALAAYAEGRGFRVQRGVAGMPTAFVATYGQGRPVIGVLGEYDALPGLSQKAVPRQEPLDPGGAGQGCGHNLFGPASLGAAVAIKELMEAGRLRGTIRFYGTPAEEAVGGKIYMVREGLFRDVDAVVAWHPDTETRADTRSSQAMVDVMVEFRGKAAHAAFDPWNGRSALDGLEIFVHALNLMREHVKPSVRMHYTVVEGGGVPNVVPDRARLWCWLRDNTRDGVEDLLSRVNRIAEGAALATGVESEVKLQTGSYEMLPSQTGARIMQANLETLGPIPFTEEEVAFAREIQRNAGVEPTGMKGEVEPFEADPPEPDGGSTDVADVSWNVPTIHVSVATAPAGVPWHSWAVVAASGAPVGERAMLYTGKALAMTMVDLYEDAEKLEEMRREFEEKIRGHVYRPYIPDGPPPLPRD